MNSPAIENNLSAEILQQQVKRRSDRLMNIFLPFCFAIGIALATYYDTWLIALGVGGLALIAYYSVKLLMPKSDFYQYILSIVLGIFMAQYIYQMHGLFEMHFFAFIGSAVLITYQKWTLQIPMFILVVVHHIAFSYLQNTGVATIYFTQLDYFTLQTLIIHFALTGIIFFISGLLAFQLNKFSIIFITNVIQVKQLQKEAQYAAELALLNNNLQKQAKELEFSNAALEQFAYAASHDLQEPLRTITSFLTLIENRYTNTIDARGRQYIQFAIEGAQRMRQMITDLLEFSSAGKDRLVQEEVNIYAIVAEFQQLYQEQITAQQAAIRFNNLPVIQSYRVPLKQIIQNLLSNALKYTKPGQPAIVAINCHDTETHWQFSVADNGIGMRSEDLEKIFVIFKRLHAQAEYAGTGIGLAVTKKLIEYLEGDIWVESAEGVGSTFHFCIPKKNNTEPVTNN